jgi:hypothetical protein
MVGHPQSLVLSPRLDVPQSRDRAVASVVVHVSRNHGMCAPSVAGRLSSYCLTAPVSALLLPRSQSRWTRSTRKPDGIDAATKTDRHSPLARGVLRRVGCGAGERAGSPADTWVDRSGARCEWRDVPIPTRNGRPNKRGIGLGRRRSTLRVGCASYSPCADTLQRGEAPRSGAVADGSCWSVGFSAPPRRTMDWDPEGRRARGCCGRCGG